MKLKTQKRIAADVLKCSPKKVVFDNERLDEIKEAITKADIKLLVSDHGIAKRKTKGISKSRIRKTQAQKKKGRQRGQGSRKGTYKARTPKKTEWMKRIRLQRKFLAELKDKNMFTTQDYRVLYNKAKGGFFRSKQHIKLYINEQKMVLDKKSEKKS